MILLTFLGVVTLFSQNKEPEQILRQIEISNETNKNHLPDFVITESKTSNFDETGKLTSILISDKAEHFEAEKRSELVTPKLVFYNAEKLLPWQLSAKRGTSLQNGNKLKLWHGVHLWQTQNDGSISELKTSEMEIKPKQQVAWTKELVTLSAANHWSEGIGMRANLKQEKIHLISNVRGIHELP